MTVTTTSHDHKDPPVGDRWKHIIQVIVAVIAALITAIVALWLHADESRQSEAARREEILRDARSGLDSTSITERVGAIHDLETLGNDYAATREEVSRILAVFVRNHGAYDESSSYPEEELRYRAQDIYEAMRVISVRGFVPDSVRIDLHGLDIRQINLVDPPADWDRFDLSDARIDASTDLPDVSLRHANVHKAHFDHADMSGADMRDIEAEGAYFKDVNFGTARFNEGSNLTDSCVVGADLQHVTGLEHATTTGMKASAATDWPPGFEPEEHGILMTDDCVV